MRSPVVGTHMIQGREKLEEPDLNPMDYSKRLDALESGDAADVFRWSSRVVRLDNYRP